MADRTVHATSKDGDELTRYNRAGKWYVEPKEGKRRLVTLDEAIAVTLEWCADGGDHHADRPGGGRFDHLLRHGYGD